MEKKTAIIIGAGAAGLMAANELAGEYDITILEASSRLGGRIYSQRSTNSSQMIEGGAEFIHGHQKLTLQLLKEAGIGYVPVEGNMYRKEKESWVNQMNMGEGWDELMKQMKKLKTDMTLHDLLQQYFGNEDQAALRLQARHYAEGFDLADIKKATVKSLYNEWSQESDENFRIPAGYGALISYLKDSCEKKGCRILTNTIVKQVDWEKDHTTVYTSNEEKYYANKLIVTVPVAVLIKPAEKASINFTPPLDEQISAANDIGIGAVIKVVLHFHKPFWKEDTGFILSDEIFPTWWTQLPDTSPVLSGWIGGPAAEKLSDQSDEELLEKALLSLSSIFDIPVDELKKNIAETHVFNWQKAGEALHGYSYNTLKTPAAHSILNTPVEGTIFFAGEAVYDGNWPGTVEAALVSGKEVAERLRKT